jgi:hypothetical protein
MSKPNQEPPNSKPQKAPVSRRRLVCPDCGSADLLELASGHRHFDVTYYADGGWDDRSGDEWEVETWFNECNNCGAEPRFDQLVAETG